MFETESFTFAQEQNVQTEWHWPPTDLETVEACPACGCTARTRLHGGLKDWAFHCAPGEWSLWLCAACESGYLDPRPNRASIGRAYSNYYTHRAAVAPCDYESLFALWRWRRSLANGYVSWRYGTPFHEPACKLGVVAALLAPPLKIKLDHKYRNLPRRSDCNGALLDFGCGEGNFLQLAASCRWKTLGVDLDGVAVARARERGLVVLEGGLEVLAKLHDEFDVITISHVIEHVHDPIAVLETCYRVLKPGGKLWIETPNIDSYSHARFGRFWRGIEAPRHLIIFNDSSLRRVITRVGFVGVERLRRPSAFRSLYLSSQAIELAVTGKSHVSAAKLRFEPVLLTFLAMVMPQRREHLTMTAQKPKADVEAAKK